MPKLSCCLLFLIVLGISPALSNAPLLDENPYPHVTARSAISAFGSCGNMDQFMGEMGSSDTLKDVGLMALTAGAARGLGQAVGAASHGLKATAVQAGVSTLGRMMSGEKDLGRAALQGTLTAAATSAGALAANQIGEMYAHGTGSLDYIEHKGLHAVVGGALGAASNLDDPLRGAAGGATGAVVAEVSAEALQHSLGDTWKKSTYGTIGKFSGTLAGWAAGDPNAGSLTAVSAMENNFDLSQAKHLSQTRSETDFVDDMLADHEQEKGPISEAQRSVLKERFLKLYYMLPQVDLAQTFGNPGHERVEDITSLSFEELRAQRLAEIPPAILATSEGRQRAEQSVRNEYQVWQSKQTEMMMGGVLAATVGGGALRGAALKGKAPSVRSTSGVAGAESKGESFSKLRIADKQGKALRAEDIPSGSQLVPLERPGRVMFDGVEFRAVRDLSHLSVEELRIMELRGIAARDVHGIRLDGHHFNQLSHRNREGFIIEIPEHAHKYSNKVQHPIGGGGSLPSEARKEWENSLRKKYWKERAKTELKRRGPQ